MDSDWILSRKIAYKSLTRHFAGWKMRQFILDSIHSRLEIRTPENSKITIVQFNTPSVAIGRHYYAMDSNHLLWIRYYDTEEKCPKEIVMKFSNKETFDMWEKKLGFLVEQYQGEIQEKSLTYVDALASFLREKSQCQHLLHEDCEETAEYFEHEDSNWNDDDSAIEVIEDDEYFEESRDTEDRECSQCIDIPSVDIHGEKPPPMKKPAEKNLIKKSLRPLTVPHMNILIMAVGTRGDIQPFTQLGLRLKQDGHRVRIATHSMFREYITDKGLEFFPLAGDPMMLSEFMVKTKGFIIPTSPDLLMEAPKHHAMIVEIINSCWGACVSPDPKDELGRDFAADVIISNPVTYAHAHCAEALGIPLHLMFPQPWTPTKAFPHPLSCLSYQKPWCAENHLSYQIIERTMWLSFERDINRFRVSVGLEPLRTGQGGWNMLNYHRVPFVKMWSPSLVPKPKDWDDHVDVVGTFMESIPIVNPKLSVQPKDMKAAKKKMNTSYDPRVRKMKIEDSVLPVATTNYEPTTELAEFLATEEPIIFVGFGSMVVHDLKSIISLFLEAAALAGVKILIQVGWSSIAPEVFMELALQAQTKACLIRETEAVNLGESLIFPSSSRAGKESGDEYRDILTRLEAGASSTSSLLECPSEQTQAKSSLGSWIAGALQLGTKFTTTVAESIVNLSTSSTKPVEMPKSESIRFDWDEVENDEWTAAKDSFFMGPCPHNWLFQKVSAVVHHGGAGTTASGLRFGCPTWICPFFGDQFFWGEMVFRANLGPRPCPINQLTLPLVVEAFEKLKDTQLKENAFRMSSHMATEDGVEAAVNTFYRHLPLENMLCDVSLFHGEYTLAHEYCIDCGMKMSSKMSQAIHSDSSLHLQGHKTVPCCYFDWSPPPPAGATEGIVQGVGSLVHEMLSGVTEAVQDPVKGIYNDGLQGAMTGVVSGLNTLVHHQITGGTLLYEKLKEGVLRSYGYDIEQHHDGHHDETSDTHKLQNIPRKPMRVITHTCSEQALLIRQKRAQVSSNTTFPRMKSLAESMMSAMTEDGVSNPASPMIVGNSSSGLRFSRGGFGTHPPSKLDTKFIVAHDGLEGLRAPPNILSPIQEEESSSIVASNMIQRSAFSDIILSPPVENSLEQPIASTWDLNNIDHMVESDGHDLLADACDDLLLQLDEVQPLSSSVFQDIGKSTVEDKQKLYHEQPGNNALLDDLTKSMMNPEVRSFDQYDDFENDSVVTNSFGQHESLIESQILENSHQRHSNEFHGSSHSLPPSVLLDSFKTAHNAHKLFKAVGASNGRFMSEKAFLSLMQKVMVRSQALLNDEELMTSPFGVVVNDEEKGAMLQSSLQILSRRKKYLEFVNFASFLINVVNKESHCI